MDGQTDAESPACTRCGAPRGMQPDWEQGELTCVVCGAQAYVPPQVMTFDLQSAPEGFLDDIYERVMKRVQGQQGEAEPDPIADLLQQLGDVPSGMEFTPSVRFRTVVRPCTAHPHRLSRSSRWTTPERAALAEQIPIGKRRGRWHSVERND